MNLHPSTVFVRIALLWTSLLHSSASKIAIRKWHEPACRFIPKSVPGIPRAPIRLCLDCALDQSKEDTSIYSTLFLDLFNRSPPTVVLDGCRVPDSGVSRSLAAQWRQCSATGQCPMHRHMSSHDEDRLNIVIGPSGTTSISGATTLPSARSLNSEARKTLTSIGWYAASAIIESSNRRFDCLSAFIYKRRCDGGSFAGDEPLLQ
jgi:hypothetical protein